MGEGIVAGEWESPRYTRVMPCKARYLTAARLTLVVLFASVVTLAQPDGAPDLRIWLTQTVSEDFPDRLEADELTERQRVLLEALRAQPEFEAFLAELPATNRAYFADYFAWQLDEEFPQDLRGADRFVHTIMNDLARVRLIPEDDIAVWRRERERQFDLLLNPVRAELRRVLMERALPDGTIESILATFERRVVATKRWLTNPACAACDRPSSPEDLASMIAYRESQFEAITNRRVSLAGSLAARRPAHRRGNPISRRKARAAH